MEQVIKPAPLKKGFNLSEIIKYPVKEINPRKSSFRLWFIRHIILRNTPFECVSFENAEIWKINSSIDSFLIFLDNQLVLTDNFEVVEIDYSSIYAVEYDMDDYYYDIFEITIYYIKNDRYESYRQRKIYWSERNVQFVKYLKYIVELKK